MLTADTRVQTGIALPRYVHLSSAHIIDMQSPRPRTAWIAMRMHDAPRTCPVAQNSADAERRMNDTKAFSQMVVKSSKLSCVSPVDVLHNR
jgi:hypothetical protein